MHVFLWIKSKAVLSCSFFSLIHEHVQSSINSKPQKMGQCFSFEHPTSANGLIDGLGAPVVWILGIPRMERECYFGVSINWNPASCHHKKVGFGSGSSKLKGLLEGRWRAPELAWPYILVNQLPPPKKNNGERKWERERVLFRTI